MQMINTPELALQNSLNPGERLLWSAQPRKGILLRPSDAFMIPFSLLWGGFALFWEGGVLQSNAPPFFVLFGAPFVLIGLYMAIGRFYHDALVRERTYYGVTDKRVLILSTFITRKLISLPLDSLSEIRLNEKSDGSGTLQFGPTLPHMMYGWPQMAGHGVPAFEAIPQAKGVQQLIMEAKEKGAIGA